MKALKHLVVNYNYLIWVLEDYVYFKENTQKSLKYLTLLSKCVFAFNKNQIFEEFLVFSFKINYNLF